jgi:hypothetical protein
MCRDSWNNKSPKEFIATHRLNMTSIFIKERSVDSKTIVMPSRKILIELEYALEEPKISN